MDVRRATRDDAGDIRRIAEASWREAYGGVLRSETIDAAMTEWYDVDGIEASLKRDDVHTFVAEIDDETVGFATGGPRERDEALLARLYVEPEHWGDGIGTALLDRVIESLRADGFERLSLSVLAENEVGRAFYESRGFETRERVSDDLFGEQVTDLELVLEI